MKINAIQNQNTSFGSVRAVIYPKSYNAKMNKDLQYKHLFDRSVDKLKTMKTNVMDLLEYDKLTGKDKIYADLLLSSISDKEKEDLTVEIELCNNGYKGLYKNSRGYMNIYFPELAKEWNYPEKDDVGTKYVIYAEKGGHDLKDEDYYFFFGKLPMPTPKFLKQNLPRFLLYEGEELYDEMIREKHKSN